MTILISNTVIDVTSAFLISVPCYGGDTSNALGAQLLLVLCSGLHTVSILNLHDADVLQHNAAVYDLSLCNEQTVHSAGSNADKVTSSDGGAMDVVVRDATVAVHGGGTSDASSSHNDSSQRQPTVTTSHISEVFICYGAVSGCNCSPQLVCHTISSRTNGTGSMELASETEDEHTWVAVNIAELLSFRGPLCGCAPALLRMSIPLHPHLLTTQPPATLTAYCRFITTHHTITTCAYSDGCIDVWIQCSTHTEGSTSTVQSTNEFCDEQEKGEVGGDHGTFSMRGAVLVHSKMVPLSCHTGDSTTDSKDMIIRM